MNVVNKVSFPGLGWNFELKETAFAIKNFEIKWYALIISVGIFLAIAYVIWRAHQIKVNVDDIMDYVIYTVPIGILGARLYYVITSLADGMTYDSIWDVLNPREGGLAIYGGIIFGTIVVAVVSIVKRIPFFAIADCASPAVIMAQAIGRWGNFVNAEAYGNEITGNFFLRMQLDDGLCYHPCFLYESLWNILGFILINIFFKHKKYDGQIFLMVFGWYGLGRLMIEGLRTDSLMVGIVGMIGLVLAIASLVVCYIFIQKLIRTVASKSVTKKNIIIPSVLFASAIMFTLIFVLDLTVFHTPAFLRISQVLAGVIFVTCLTLLVVLAITKYSKPKFIKPEKAKKDKIK